MHVLKLSIVGFDNALIKISCYKFCNYFNNRLTISLLNMHVKIDYGTYCVKFVNYHFVFVLYIPTNFMFLLTMSNTLLKSMAKRRILA